MKVKLIIATHKKYDMPEDELYLPLHVGREGKLGIGYVGDNTGDNISVKNSSFCELTGLYWMWKNLDYDYLGLVHYRRHFSGKNLLYRGCHNHSECILTSKELEPLLDKYSVIVPKKRHYYIESLYSHYEHTHYKEHLDMTRAIIEEKYPEYLTDYDETVYQTSGYMFNMFIMKKELVCDYCGWLFDILFELEQRAEKMGVSYSQFQGRFYGRVSEIIFNAWLHHQHVTVKEIPYIHLGKINWIKKGKSFIEAKIHSKKYEHSF